VSSLQADDHIAATTLLPATACHPTADQNKRYKRIEYRRCWMLASRSWRGLLIGRRYHIQVRLWPYYFWYSRRLASDLRQLDLRQAESFMAGVFGMRR